jgi:alpha-mannosidase
MILIKERVGKLIDCIHGLVYSSVRPIEAYRMVKTEERFEDVKNIHTENWDVLKKEAIWGGHREFYYFETVVEIPEEYEGKAVVYELRTGKEGEWDALNPQFLAYVNGEIRQGLDVNHRQLYLTDSAKAGEKFTILLSAFTGDNNFSLLMDSEVKILNKEVEKYYYDISVPYEVARLLPKDDDDYISIIQCLNESLNLLDLRKPYSDGFYQSLEKAQNYITEEFYDKRCGDSKEVIACVGHTHIDCAWLWTLRTTQDKAVRSFSTVLELMRRYPEYKFMSSQPQLYDYVKKNAPEVYEEIKERVKEGRWETEGGMWVEADCNISSGESLVRQFMYGLRFFKDEFGTENEILWLPDVFGYSAALPQIMQKCGIHYFMTTKISWNEFNKMPYDTFLWEGIDGTEVLTHFSSSRDYGKGAVEGGTETEHFTTYNAMLTPSQVKGNWQRYSQKELHTESLMSYGFGDGGGGPTEVMLENCRRMEKGIPGCPKTKQSHTKEFFHRLEKDVEGNRFLPKWVGELYLEYHRGTYTSMARNKKYNRKSEFAYENLEFYQELAKALTGLPYPKELLRESWEVILRNQFHDILPGSSIKEVYEDSKEEYEGILAKAKVQTEAALGALAEQISGKAGDVIVFNPNSAVCAAPVSFELPAGVNAMTGLTDGSRVYPVQKTEDGYVAVVEGVPAKGYRVLQPVQSEEEAVPMIRDCGEIETPYFIISLNESGQFTRIYDKKNDREVIPSGKVANQIITYEDKPHNYDAWDINNYYTEKSWPVDETSSIEIVENGAVRACIRVDHPYLDSKIVQYLYFYRDLPQIDIRNEIDWNEEQILVRDYFPVDIHTNEATFEIQYGNVKRPTHGNTMWDFAKFEVCAHKWLDVSEDGYGVSVLNDCKYGCSVRDGVIGLSMLKSALYPNPAADKEHHTFWYSICPHTGDFREGRTVDKAYMLNNPMKALCKEAEGGTLQKDYSFVSAEEDHVVIEVVKQAEEGEDTILRLYECSNRRGKLHLHVAGNWKAAYETDMLENNEKELCMNGNVITADVKPYEIKTVRLCRA